MKSVRRTLAGAMFSVALAACGGGASPSSVPVATPSPVAVATPTPAPVATPTPEPEGEPPVTNETKPARLTLRLYAVEDPSGRLYDFKTAADGTPIVPVNYKFRLDVVAKDRKNKETIGSGNIQWLFSDENIIEIETFTNKFQPRLRATKAGPLCSRATLDEVFSNEICVVLQY